MESETLESVAVVGLALKFPKDATSPETFWEMLLHGRSAMTEVPKDRWNIDTFYHPDSDRHDCMNTRNGHFLQENMAFFDAPFFSLPPTEVSCMDPQQRSLLECTYHALENAGMPMASVIGSRTSVFVGSFSREYETILSKDTQMQAKYKATGTGSAMLANRLSWFYDLHGPSISLDTACSSSLTALHLAVQSIRAGESDMAIVAGCNLILNPETNSIPLSNLGFLGRDGVCYSFDHRANGYARGEGTAVVILKPIPKALEENDVLRAVIRNTGSNQDGRTPGITQPSTEAQIDLIRETYAKAGLKLQETGFFEAHGTGTIIGDSREARAVGAVFKDYRQDPLIVGAVKSNIGHLEGASGLAGFIKSILVLEKGLIPPNIWFEKPNPDILVDEWKIKFPIEQMPWPKNGLRRASVNSFGYGGANAHVVVDDAFHYLSARSIPGKHVTIETPPSPGNDPPTQHDAAGQRSELEGANAAKNSTDPERPRIFAWSASDEGGLQRLTENYYSYLQNRSHKDDNFMSNLAYTLSDRRSRLMWKSFLVSDSADDLQNGLSAGRLSKPVCSSSTSPPELAFVFTGQGAQWYAMGKELFMYSTFENSLRSAEAYLRLLGCEWFLTEEMTRAEKASNVDNPAYAQPLCTALQIALVDLLKEWNITPTAVVGHSSGEIAAAYCAGAISRESAWRISYYRGVLAARLEQQSNRNGSMIAVALSPTSLQPYLARTFAQVGQDDLAIGCINGPENLTLTGDSRCVDAIKAYLDQERIFARKLNTSVAYHSSHMEEIAVEYRTLIGELQPGQRQPKGKEYPKLFSSVTGEIITAQELCKPDYWVKNMVSLVNFSGALSALSTSLYPGLPDQTEGMRAFLIEIGPHGALRRPIKETLSKAFASSKLSYGTALNQNVSALNSIMELMGTLLCNGCNLDLPPINDPGVQTSDLHLLCDLPRYPFNHSQLHWLESRLSRNYRFNEVPRHELLGIRSNDWNPLEPKWRNIIRVSELPWIEDHKFNGSELYPAAGIIVMAIEAARQVSDPSRKVSKYVLEDVSFLKPLLVTLAPEGVETQFHLRACKDNATSAVERKSFNLYLFSSDDWIEICNGIIMTEYQDEESFTALDSPELHKSFTKGSNECTRVVDPRDVYENLEKFGYGFGPSFQGLKQVYFSNDSRATATLDPREWTGKVKASHETQDHVIHPTALDAAMHLTVVALSKGTWMPIPTMVPTKIERIQISNSLLAHTKDQQLQVFTEATFNGYRDTNFSVCAFDNIAHEFLILFEGYRGTVISTFDSSSLANNKPKTLCYDIDWKPDWGLLTSEQLTFYCDNSIGALDRHDPKSVDQGELLCFFYLSETLDVLSAEEPLNLPIHISKYFSWLKMRLNQYETSSAIPNPNEGRPSLKDKAYFRELLDQLGRGPEIDVINEVGRNLPQILRGEVDALGILFTEDRAKGFYDGLTFASSYQKAAAYIDLLAHKDPSLKVVEVGAGTGASTSPILEKLSRHGLEEGGRPRFGEWTYTDISSGFFEAAAVRFSEYAQLMQFKVLDIEKDPISQGFEAARYDVVLASAVLHATADIKRTLSNARVLLKPGGKLILIEPCNLDTLRIPFVFGLLPGWWLGTEYHRKEGPLLSHEGWDRALQSSGFSGTDICLGDFQDHRHTASVLISTASEENLSFHPGPHTLIVVRDDCTRNRRLAEQLKSRLNLLEVRSCEVVNFSDISAANVRKAFVISLLEVDGPFLYDIEEGSWSCFKAMMQSAKVLWLTRGKENTPELNLITGLGRSLQSEDADLRFIELALEETCSISNMVDHAVRVFKAALVFGPPEQGENEFLEKDGLLHINRVVEANYLNDRLHAQLSPQGPQMRKIHEKNNRLLSLSIKSPGLLDTLQFEEGELPADELLPNEVEIEVKAVGINFKDVLIALGQIPSNTLGLECSGVVIRTGTAVSKVRHGDRVCCIAIGAYKNRVCVDAVQVSIIPAFLPFSTAAGCPLSLCIAYHALVNIARLKEGESVLIQSGAEAVGQAAIQLASMLKADIYCTVGSKEKSDLLTRIYQVPQDRIFVGKGASYMPKLKRVTAGVDVVLYYSHTGEGFRQSWGCVGPLGRVVDISQTDKPALKDVPGKFFAQNITYSTVDMSLIIGESRTLVEELMNSVMELLADNRISAAEPINVYRSSEVEKAFRVLQSGQSIGKTVIEMCSDDVVPIVPFTGPTWYFREDASYVVVGGLGGLGRSIARWMADRKAKHLLLLGRSGAKDEVALRFVKELRDRGIDVLAPPCDISQEGELKYALETCSKSMPPIRGCIQGSMVLRDGLFETMSWDDYQAAVRPKAHGSWNLHQQLPRDLDFFVLLASSSGITGTRGQSNYASGNTYQDGLARYRVSHGLKCISLDLGLIISAGWAAEKRDALQSLMNTGVVGIREAEMLAMLDYCCDPDLPLPITTPLKSQIVTGVEFPKRLMGEDEREGMDRLRWARRPLFRILAQMDGPRASGSTDSQGGATAAEDSIDYKVVFAESGNSIAPAARAIAKGLRRKLAKTLWMSEQDVDTQRPLQTYGVDSLVAVELRYWFAKVVHSDVSIFEIQSDRSITALSHLAAGKSEYLSSDTSQQSSEE